MKKLPLIFTIALFTLCVGGYFVYVQFIKHKKLDVWDLVPESSVLVYESGTCAECNEVIKQSTFWSIIREASFYAKSSDSLKSIYDFLSNSHYNAVSLHVTKKDDFDFVFYQHIDEKTFGPVLNQWKKNKSLKFSTRELNAVRIEEISFQSRTFSWAFIDGVWIGSFTPFLLEDVIRTYEADGDINFKERITDVYQMPKVNKEGGNLYIHLKNFAEWLSVFADGNAAPVIRDFGKSTMLDIKADGKKLILNGFSSDSAARGHYALSIFSNQSPVPFNTKKIISNRTVILTSYGISDGLKFKSDLSAYAARKVFLKDTLAILSKSLKFDVDKVFENIRGEIGVCFVESKGQEIAKVMLVETKQSDLMIDALNDISSQLSKDTVFYEKFSDYDIRELPLYRFPEKLLWPLASGFNKCYYTSIGNTVVVSEDLEELKNFLEDIDQEETWGKSVNQNKYLESTLLESNISLYVNTPKVWHILAATVNPRWKSFISENESLLQSLGMGAIQFSHLSESFYTNVTWSYQQPGKKPDHASPSQRTITNLSNPVSKMFVFKSHVDRQDEVLVQDSTFNIHLISNTGKVLWKRAVDGMIMGNVEQIDYYNNGKLQFYFIAKNKIYIIDRLGNYLKPFPVALPVNDLEYSSVVDYDHSRKYRFLVASSSGRLWMFDKEGKNLDGWQPKIIEEGLAAMPQHHRIRGRDYILAICKNGKVYAMNRRGETLKNFPLNLDGKPSGGYFVELGNDLEHTFFVVISKDGFRIKFNLQGKIQSRETLIKTVATANFTLVKELKGKSYLIARQEAKQLTLMDSDNKVIITNDFVGLDPVTMSYVDFGSGNIYVTITDTRQGLSFIYDRKGNLLTTPPVESYHIIPRVSDTEKPTIFAGYQNTVSIQPLP